MNNPDFWFVVKIGDIPMADRMLRGNPYLIGIRDENGMTPLHLAALNKKAEMARRLYSNSVDIFVDQDWETLFFACINSGICDLVLKMLDKRPHLALARDINDETALHILSRNHLDLGYQIAEYRNQHLNSGMRMEQTQIPEIVDCLWKNILRLQHFESVELNDRNQSIIHVAVLHRHYSIYSLIHKTALYKDIIVSTVDAQDGNNLIHLAAKLAPAGQLELISGAAFQMWHELLWFEEIKKIMPPSYIRMKNNDGMTPRELFTNEHRELLKEARTWMKETANSCMILSSLVTAGVFSAAFNLPGGNNDDSGIPNYLGKTAFLTFVIADVIAMTSSLSSIMIFMSILLSRQAQLDFYRSLPTKLIYGMVALFISIVTMMIAYNSVFFVSYYHGTKWVPSSISIIAAIPTIVFVSLQYSSWSNIIYSTYFCRSLFLPK